jgi:hypothetical protein
VHTLARAREWARDRLGRRGSFLLFLAVLDFTYGWAIYDTVAPPVANRVNLLLPWQAWGIWWAATGLVCLIAAWGSRDRWAFTIAAALKFAWGMIAGFAWLNQPQLDHNGWVSMVIWLCFAITVLIISGWPEPPPLPVIPPLPTLPVRPEADPAEKVT